MKEFVKDLKEILDNPHESPVALTENEGRKLIAEIERLEGYNKILGDKINDLIEYQKQDSKKIESLTAIVLKARVLDSVLDEYFISHGCLPYITKIRKLFQQALAEYDKEKK